MNSNVDEDELDNFLYSPETVEIEVNRKTNTLKSQQRHLPHQHHF